MNITKVKSNIAKIIESEWLNVSLMIHSAPGIGKSAIVKQLAKEYNMELVDVRLSTMDLATFLGVPHVNKNHEFVWGNPEWYQKIIDVSTSKNVILFFDEITNAAQSLQHAAYRVILDRELREFSQLPDNVIIIAAGNRVEDNTGAKPLLPALANRFNMHFFVEPDNNAFMTYAINKGFNENVIGFLNWAPRFGYKPPKNGETCFPTYRAWEFVSDWLKIFEPSLEHLQGIVGPAAAADFMTYYKYVKKMPNIEKIKNGDLSELEKVSDIGIEIALTVNLAFHAVDDLINASGYIKNIRKALDKFDDEKLILFYKIIANTERSKEFNINYFLENLEKDANIINKYKNIK